MNVVSFYRFLDLQEPPIFRDALQALCEQQGLLGTVLVATEGFNGTIAGKQASIEIMFAWVKDYLSLNGPIDARWTDADEAPFRRMRVRVKKEIVTLGRTDILPHEQTGKHVPVQGQVVFDPCEHDLWPAFSGFFQQVLIP